MKKLTLWMAVAALLPARAAFADADGGAPPREIGRSVGQYFAGVGTVLGATAVAGVTGPVGLVVFVGTPALVGEVVCAVGNGSAHYQGSCAPAIVGAYIGFLSVLPLGVLGTVLFPAANSDVDDGAGIIFALAVGWLVVEPLAATVAWRLWKQPRRATPLGALPAATLARHSEERRSGLPAAVAVPVLSLAF
jgi:hypothetical protein